MQDLEQLSVSHIIARRMLLNSTVHIFDDFPKSDHYLRIEQALSLAIDALMQGSTCFDADEQQLVSSEELAAIFEVLHNCPSVCHVGSLETAYRSVPLILDNNKLYLSKYAAMESRCAQYLIAKLQQHPASSHDTEAIISSISGLMSVGDLGMLSPHQVQALLVAATHKLTVLTGGPGTGKTTVVVRMLEVLRQQAKLSGETLRIHLATPTGKAAQRLQESVYGSLSELSIEAQEFFQQLPAVSTLQSLLKQTPGAFVKKRSTNSSKLVGDVFVVDEVSMIPLQLMMQLLEALPEHAQLILVGDPYQLASVEAGTVIADVVDGIKALAASSAETLVPRSLSTLNDRLKENWERQAQERSYEAESWSVQDVAYAELGLVELKRAHRFKGDVASLVYAIKDIEGLSDELEKAQAIGGLIAELREKSQDASSELYWLEDLEHQESSELGLGPIGKQLLSHFKELEDLVNQGELQTALLQADNMRLLCAQQVGYFGVEGYNQRIAQELQSLNSSNERNRYGERIGCPLMVTKNNKRLGVSNGDTGILGKDESGKWCVHFLQQDNKIMSISRVHFDSLAPAYAITIHKSQGSQYLHAAVCLSRSAQSNLNTRELLYTAVSRAKRKVSICASEEALRSSLATRISRASGLIDKLIRFGAL